MEFAVSAWNLYTKREKIATKKTPGLGNLSYEERLRKLNLTSLQERRVSGYLIEQFKIIKGFDNVNWYNKPMCIDNEHSTRPITRDHRFKIIKKPRKKIQD